MFRVIVAMGVLLLAGGCTATSSTAPVNEPPKAAPALTPCPTHTAGLDRKHLPSPPPTAAAMTGTAVITLETNIGTIVIDADRSKTPCTAAFLGHFARMGLYQGSACHRLTTAGIFVLQCGDPSHTGMSGPDFAYPEENLPARPSVSPTPSCPPLGQSPLPTFFLNPSLPPPDPDAIARDRECLEQLMRPKQPRLVHPKGTVAMANAGPGTTGSQFFFVYQDSEFTPNYTVLGRVRTGMEIVERIAADGLEQGTGDGAPRSKLIIKAVTIE